MKFYTHQKSSPPFFSHSLSVTDLFYFASNYGLASDLGISGAAQMANISGLRATLRQDCKERYVLSLSVAAMVTHIKHLRKRD